MKLYSYHRSSAAYRVRIVLNLKQVPHEIIGINLLKAEEQKEPYTKLNPQGLVPSLEDEGVLLTQSSAIIEYLEEKYPPIPLLPNKPSERAVIRSITNLIACDIHPLDNLRVLKYLTGQLDISEDQKLTWYKHWIKEGFKALEIILNKHSKGQYSFGDSPTIADAYLIPQVYNAHRFEVDMSEFPLITQINKHCLTLEAFEMATPEKQPDA